MISLRILKEDTSGIVQRIPPGFSSGISVGILPQIFTGIPSRTLKTILLEIIHGFSFGILSRASSRDFSRNFKNFLYFLRKVPNFFFQIFFKYSTSYAPENYSRYSSRSEISMNPQILIFG